MTTITFKEKLNINKTHFKSLKEFNLQVNSNLKKGKKLSTIEIINKYKLNKKYKGKKINILNETDNIAYNI